MVNNDFTCDGRTLQDGYPGVRPQKKGFMLSAKEQLDIIKRGAVEIIVEADLLKKLEKSVANGSRFG